MSRSWKPIVKEIEFYPMISLQPTKEIYSMYLFIYFILLLILKGIKNEFELCYGTFYNFSPRCLDHINFSNNPSLRCLNALGLILFLVVINPSIRFGLFVGAVVVKPLD